LSKLWLGGNYNWITTK